LLFSSFLDRIGRDWIDAILVNFLVDYSNSFAARSSSGKITEKSYFYGDKILALPSGSP
jgi:hypothetical protein